MVVRMRLSARRASGHAGHTWTNLSGMGDPCCGSQSGRTPVGSPPQTAIERLVASIL
jgi:hypothetical protein